MKKTSPFLLLFLFIVLVCGSCSESNNPNEESGDKDGIVEDIDIDECENLTIQNFRTFFDIEFGMTEDLLENKLGKFTGGDFTEDSAIFIYRFNRVDRVPISVWVNSETHKVVTIFMEVLSMERNFQMDLDNAIEEFSMDNCEGTWFGLSIDEIKQRLGTPIEESVSAKGVTLLSYDSEDYSCSVAFKFYPEQGQICSSVSVNWFYN